MPCRREETFGRDGKYQLSFKIACESDERLLLEWRNEETVRQQSFTSDIVTAEAHHKWFQTVMKRPDITILILHLGEIPVGCMRFECHETWAELSYSIDRRYRGSGIGKELIHMSIDYAEKELLLSQLRAKVKKNNLPSQKVLSVNRFQKIDESTDQPYFLFVRNLRLSASFNPDPPPQYIPEIRSGYTIIALPLIGISVSCAPSFKTPPDCFFCKRGSLH